MTQSNVNWPRFVEIIRASRRIVLTSHVRPDCDALGSELGMAGILESLGKQVLICNPQETPPNLAFIDPDRRIRIVGKGVQPAELADFDLLMVLDTSAWAQLGAMGDVIRSLAIKKIVLDHHVGADDLGAEEFKNTTAEATGRLVVEAARALGAKLSPAVARALFAALTTDTGWMRFSSTTAETFRIAAELVDSGAVPAEIYNALYEQETLARVRLRGRILERAATELDGRLIHTACLLEDFDATGALPSDTEDVINATLTVRGTEVAVILVEHNNGGFKISFRSRSAVDCSQLAAQFGGGGHKAAAGAMVTGTFADARRRVLDAVFAAMR
ncbi:MAG: DHH family phosphoesterase [Pirellulales bacterium]|nr:DHH family phosphoesterase [Pirellulales bacterium]